MARVNICWFCYEVSAQFSSVRTYLEEVERSRPDIEQRLRRESKQRLTDLGAMADEAEYQIESQILEHIVEVDLPQQANYAGVILVFSAVEASFKRLVTHLIKYRQAKLDLDAFSGRLLERVERFLLVHDFSPLNESEITRMKEFSRIRNCIVGKRLPPAISQNPHSRVSYSSLHATS